MKIKILLILCMLYAVACFSNINHIDFTKISKEEKLKAYFSFLKDNREYCNHWEAEWKYDIDKEGLILKLKQVYAAFLEMPSKNTDLYLLKGEIAHYLYDLDVSIYYDSAVNNYTLAMQSNPLDYRADWFLAYHYSLANVPEKAIDLFLKAQDMKPTDKPTDFWEEYAFATTITQMPSHTIFAMEKIRSITGKPGVFETQVGSTVYKRMVNLNKDSDYTKKEIWTAGEGEKINFVSRPLGIKIVVDSSWDLSVYDYTKHQSAFVITPPGIKNKKGKEVNYTVAILMATADDTQRLEHYVNKFIAKYSDKKKVLFSDKYNKTIAYEIHDKTMYPNVGGGHLYIVGVERGMPKLPGYLLENPVSISDGEKGKVNYYRSGDFKNRFKGRVFYLFMLDTCEDIYEQSFATFKTLFDRLIIIE